MQGFRGILSSLAQGAWLQQLRSKLPVERTQRTMGKKGYLHYLLYPVALLLVVVGLVLFAWFPVTFTICNTQVQEGQGGEDAVVSVQVSYAESHEELALVLESKGKSEVFYVECEGRVLYTPSDKVFRYGVIALPNSLESGGSTEVLVHLNKFDERHPPEAFLCPISALPAFFAHGQDVRFPVAVVLFSMAGVIFIILAGSGSLFAIKRKAALLAIAAFLFSIVFLNSGGHYRLFVSNDYAWTVFYSVVCLITPPICLLYFREYEPDERRRELIVVGVAYSVLFCVLSIVFVAATSYTFEDLRPLFYLSLIPLSILGAFETVMNFGERTVSPAVCVLLFVISLWPAFAMLLDSPSGEYANFGDVLLNPDSLSAACLLVAFFFLAIKDTVDIREAISRERLERESAEVQLVQARCESFASQIQPHFLCNTVNCIQELMIDDPDQASDALDSLSGFLSSAIRVVTGELRPFAEEVETIRQFADLEIMRFGDKLSVEYRIRAQAFDVPPLSIQPFFENAIVHGVRQMESGGGTVVLESWEEEENWLIRVSDDGVGFDFMEVLHRRERGTNAGVGLRNSIQRLELTLGAFVDIESAEGKGTKVTIAIPKEQPAAKGAIE